jgi:serine/threonine-protein kinase
MDILLAHATEQAPSFKELGLKGWVPHEVEELVHECLAKDPADRPQSARELAERFDTALDRAQARLEAKAAEQRPLGTGSSGLMAGLAATALGGSGRLATAAPSAPTAVQPMPANRERSALPFHMEAWMPERIAIMKLRGFVHDAGGEVVESLPGLIKVRLGGRQSASSTLSWFGLGKKSSNTIDVELHLHKLDPTLDNKLTVHVLFHPSHPSLLSDQAWRAKCTKIFVELRGYLMGRSESS